MLREPGHLIFVCHEPAYGTRIEKGHPLGRKLKLTRFSLQLRVLRLGLLQDGDVGVGVFPEGEEVVVGGERPLCGDRIIGS